MAQNGMKMEEDYIKPEIKADTASPAGYMDDEDFDDFGELTLPSDPKGAWLTRIPAYLWEAWSKLDPDQEIEIGQVRVYGKDTAQPTIRMSLHSGIKEHQDVPKEYRLTVTNPNPLNTFIFSEKDRPGFKRKAYDSRATMSGAGGAGGPGGNNRVQKRRFKSAVPKQTALAAVANHEVLCKAVENAEFRRLMAARAEQQAKPKHTTTVLRRESDIVSYNNMAAQAAGKFKDMVRTNMPPKGKRPQENKAARMPENELLDKLIACFRRYRYWRLQTLRQELRQPEAYLKETLNKIAVLIKSGSFAMTYELKNDFKDENLKGVDAENQNIAPVKEDSESEVGDDDDDDEDLKMEDVPV